MKFRNCELIAFTAFFLGTAFFFAVVFLAGVLAFALAAISGPLARAKERPVFQRARKLTERLAEHHIQLMKFRWNFCDFFSLLDCHKRNSPYRAPVTALIRF